MCRCHITSVTRSSRQTDETTTPSWAPQPAALALVSLGGVGDKSDDRHGDERARLLRLLLARHPHFPSVNSRTIDTATLSARPVGQSVGQLSRLRGLVMLPAKGIGDDAVVRSTYCLITIAIVISIVRRKYGGRRRPHYWYASSTSCSSCSCDDIISTFTQSSSMRRLYMS